jgi:outer membrane protein TolC
MKKMMFLLMLFIAALSCALPAEEMTWQQSVDEALVNNPSLISARAKLDQTKANNWQTFAAALPQVSASASGSRSGNEPYGGPYTKADSYSYDLTAKQLVFDFFKTLQDMEGAGENAKAAEKNYIISSASVRYNLMQAYSGMMKAQQYVDITEAILKLRKQQMADIKQRYFAGREHKGSMMSVEASLAQADYDNKDAIRGLELARITMANALGRDKYDGLSVKIDFTASDDLTSEPDFNKLCETNPDILMLTAQKNSAANSAGSSISAFLPSVYISGSVGRSDDAYPLQNTNWSVGVSASLPLLDGGKLIAQSAAAQAALRQAEADLKGGRADTLLQLKNTWSGYKDASENLQVQKKSLDAYKERAMIADTQYTTGLITFNDWTIIQDGLVSAQKSYLNAQANLLISEAAWIQAKGGTLEDEKK